MSLQIIIGLALAIGCAVATNVAAVLKHRGANAVPSFSVRHPLQSVRSLAGSPWFQAGFALALFAGVLHIVALTLAPLSVIQVVLAGGVVLLSTFAGRILGATVSGRQRVGLYAAAFGLVLLVICAPAPHGAHSSFDAASLVRFEAVLIALGAALICAPQASRLLHHRGVLLGAGAGVCFGLGDVAVKAISGLFSAGASASTIGPMIAGAVIAGIVAQVLVIRGLQEGEAVPVTALTGVTASIANITGGILVFGDPLAQGTLGLVGQTLALMLVVGGSALVPSAAESLAPRPRALAQVA